MSDAIGDGGGAERWLCIHDELLRGLAHAVSNRLATITAAAGVLEAGVTPDPRFLDGLRIDAERLELLLQQLRQLPRRIDGDLEPMLLSDALDSARRLVTEHPQLRDREITVRLVGDVMPVRAEPVAVLHAASVALLAAARLGTGDVIATLETVGDDVRLAAVASNGPHDADDLLEHDVRAMRWLLTTSRGSATATAGGCTLSLPTLQASRRRTG